MKKTAFLSLLTILISLISCNKQRVDPVFTVTGMWEGRLKAGNKTDDSYMGLNIKENGVLERINSAGTVSATGTWQVMGDTLRGAYNFNSGTVVSIGASINRNEKKLIGTWNNDAKEEGSYFAFKSFR
jgi:hypothetical protein